MGQIVDVAYVKNDKGDRVASKVAVAEKPAAPAPDKGPAVETPKKADKDDLDIGAPKDPGEKK